MNKLREWLRRTAGGETPRMGFGATAPKARGPSLGLLASLPSLKEDVVAGGVEAGAEALVIPASLAADTESLRRIIQGFPQCPWGLQWDGGQAPPPDLGFDFLLLSPSSTLSALEGEEPGRLLTLDPSWNEGQLRALDQLPLDGLVFPLMPPGEEHLRVEHLLAVRRLSLWLRKPLIGGLGRSLSAEHLGLLRDGGLSGLLVVGDTARWRETIKELRKAVEALPPKVRGRPEVDVVLPPIRGQRAPEAEEEEEP